MKLGYTVDNEFLGNVSDEDFREFDVEFEAEPFWDDDSFDYAGTHCTGGVGGTHRTPKYATIGDQDIEWDRAKHTPFENVIIEDWLAIEKNRDTVAQLFADELSDIGK